jgi:hypothetical protein
MAANYGYGYEWTPDVANLPCLLKARASEASCTNKLELEEQVVQGVDKLQLDEEVDVEHGGRLDGSKEGAVMCVTFALHHVVQFQTSRRDARAK